MVGIIGTLNVWLVVDVNTLRSEEKNPIAFDNGGPVGGDGKSFSRRSAVKVAIFVDHLSRYGSRRWAPFNSNTSAIVFLKIQIVGIKKIIVQKYLAEI